MRIDLLARDWGTEQGGAHGMAIAAGYLAHTLERLGHQVRRLVVPQGFGADLVITTIAGSWRRTVAQAGAARDRLVYWHHGGGVPDGQGCVLAAPPSIEPRAGWRRHVVLPPSSWAVEAGGVRTGSEILVPGAGPAKGGHVALQVAQLSPELRFLVVSGRSAPSDRHPWRALRNAELIDKIVPPDALLSRARAVLAPTRFEVHPLLLVEAAVRGIPIVCTDLPATRCAAPAARMLQVAAPAIDWKLALEAALAAPAPAPLKLRPYAETVRAALAELQEARAAA